MPEIFFKHKKKEEGLKNVKRYQKTSARVLRSPLKNIKNRKCCKLKRMSYFFKSLLLFLLQLHQLLFDRLGVLKTGLLAVQGFWHQAWRRRRATRRQIAVVVNFWLDPSRWWTVRIKQLLFELSGRWEVIVNFLLNASPWTWLCAFSRWWKIFTFDWASRRRDITVMTFSWGRSITVMTFPWGWFVTVVTLSRGRGVTVVMLSRGRSITVMTFSRGRGVAVVTLTRRRSITVVTFFGGRGTTVMTLSLSIWRHGFFFDPTRRFLALAARLWWFPPWWCEPLLQNHLKKSHCRSSVMRSKIQLKDCLCGNLKKASKDHNWASLLRKWDT